MRTVAVIPARGGSKGVPGKNLATVGGVPLIARAIHTCAQVAEIDEIVVSTDDVAIAEVARAYGARIVNRPAEIATDTSSSEEALLHALAELAQDDQPVDTVVFIQATSPFIPAAELQLAVRDVNDGQFDVKFSAVETFGFLWAQSPRGAKGVNHEPAHRPRRQDREPHFLETGAFYVMRAAGFVEAGHRFFGHVGIQEVPESSALEIDNPSQLRLAQILAPDMDSLTQVTHIAVDALVMDFDGVHTDDRAVVAQNGDESVTVSRSDGMGLELLRNAGLPMLILSKERNPVVSVRGDKLHIETRQGIENKLAELEDWAAQRNIALRNIAYIGNDINDLECLQAVGWAIVPADAHPAVKPLARLVLSRPGGHGALRELADLILKSA